jgi:hypothetical protein
MRKPVTLAVSHSIWLTREQRYALAGGEAGQKLVVVGASVPVWYCKGDTSEPASEVFVRYTLASTGDGLNMFHLRDGYYINIPRERGTPKLPPDVWEVMPEAEREEFYEANGYPSTARDLLDPRDGGSAWYFFRQYNKIVRSDSSVVHLIHYVELKDVAALANSLSRPDSPSATIPSAS